MLDTSFCCKKSKEKDWLAQNTQKRKINKCRIALMVSSGEGFECLTGKNVPLYTKNEESLYAIKRIVQTIMVALYYCITGYTVPIWSDLSGLQWRSLKCQDVLSKAPNLIWNKTCLGVPDTRRLTPLVFTPLCNVSRIWRDHFEPKHVWVF